MRKILAWILAALMLCATPGVLAEEGQIAPLYATVGEALAAEGRVIAGGISGDYYAVVTQKDGKYYRSVALYDEKLASLDEAANSLDYNDEDFFEKLEAALRAVEEYRMTLPIAYSEEFTAQPLSDAEMASEIGKTLSQLAEEGFETGSNFSEGGVEADDEIIVVYMLRYGVFDYRCVMDTDFDSYIAAQENGTEGELVVNSMELAGITEWGFEKRFHTDGTVDAPEDPFAAFSEVMAEVWDLIEKLQNGEEADPEELAAVLKERYPDYADMIDMYLSMLQTYGAEGLAAMMGSPAE